MLYAYTLPNAMLNHEYTDDVAITFALNKKSAVKKFQQYYGFATDETVEKISLFRLLKDICILTDY